MLACGRFSSCRAPTLLHDYHTLENAIGGHLPRGATAWTSRHIRPEIGFTAWRWSAATWTPCLHDYVATPFVRLSGGSMARTAVDRLSGR